MTTEKIRQKLLMLHEHENDWNKELSKLDWQIKMATKKKKKIATKISNNMKYRNILINQL